MQCKNPEPHEPHWHTVFIDENHTHAGAAGHCSGDPYKESKIPTPLEYQLVEAIRLTHEYIDPTGEMLPCIEGWSWWDAMVAYDPEYARQYKEQVERQHRLKYGEALSEDRIHIDPEDMVPTSDG